MPQLTADRLLADVEDLPHARRLRAFARAAHHLAREGRLSGLLAELSGRGPYEQRLAALAALTGGELRYLADRLTDPDAVVRRYAHRAVRLPAVPDEVVERAVRTAPPAVRDELLRAVLRAGRTAVAERLVPYLREQWGAAEAGRVLPVCSPAFVARELPALSHAFAYGRSLGARHPAAVLADAEHRLTGLPRRDRTAFWQRNAAGLAAAARQLPGAALDLLERHPVGQYRPTFPAPLVDCFPALAAYSPERTARMLVEAGRFRHDPVFRPALARRLRAAPLPLLAGLAHRNPADHAVLARQLPPSARLALHDAVAALPSAHARYYAAEVMATLPEPGRTARVRAGLAEYPESTDLLDFLPTAEALPRLLAETRTAEAWDRGYAWGRVVGHAARSGAPGTVREVLELLLRLRNEQDPVRNPALTALAEVPAGLFPTDCADLLAELTEETLTARDTSVDTRHQLARLACSVLALHADGGAPGLLGWAVRTVERIAPPAPVLSFPRARQAAVTQELRPVLERSTGLLLSFVGGLHPHSRRLPSVVGLLERVPAGDPEHRWAVVHLLADPRTRGERVARMLAADPAAVGHPSVRAALAEVRTDLLGALLTEDAPALDLRPADRWTDRQLRSAAALVARTVEDPASTPGQRAAALREAAHLPGRGRELLLRYVDSPDLRLAEAALAALPWTDRPAGALPVLLDLAGDRRARVALPAAARAVRFAPADEVAPALTRIAADPGSKVTSRKQAVRLAAARLPLPTATALLSAAFRAADQHPDVRRVVVEQVAARPAELPLWDVLAEIVESESDLRTELTVSLDPLGLPPADRRRYAELVGLLALSRDTLVAAMGAGQLGRWGRYAPDAVAALVPLITDLAERERWRPAARAVSALAWSGAPHPFGGAAAGSLLERVLSPLITSVRTAGAEGEDDPDRDQSARQRLAELDNHFFHPGESTAAEAAMTRAVSDLLLSEPSLLPQAVTRRVYAVDLSSAGLADELLELAALLADRPVLAERLAGYLRPAPGRQGDAPAPTGHTLTAVRRLRADGGLAAGLFAIRLVALYGPGQEWSAEWRTALHALRTHPQPEVRDRALALWTAKE